MSGRHRPASETPLKWGLVGGPIMARLKWYANPLSPHHLEKRNVKVGPPLAKLSGCTHVCPALECNNAMVLKSIIH